MWKYFYSMGNYKWTNVLEKLVSNYNNAKHSSIGIKPSDVDKKNEWQVWLRLYGSDLLEYPPPKLRVDDIVRVPKYKNIFGHGFEPNFSKEIFEVSKFTKAIP